MAIRITEVLLAVVLLSAASLGCGASDAWAPTQQLVAHIESVLTMPANTSLGSFKRYYYGETTHGHHFVMGTYVFSPNDAGVKIVSPAQSPKVLDGGCGIVNLKYDVERKKVVSIFCNGVA